MAGRKYVTGRPSAALERAETAGARRQQRRQEAHTRFAIQYGSPAVRFAVGFVAALEGGRAWRVVQGALQTIGPKGKLP